MRKHLRLFRAFFHACLVEEFEYRANLAANLLSTLFWLAMSVLTVTFYFYRSPFIGGWSYYEALALVGIFSAVHGVIEFFLQPNMSRLVNHIRKGTLDFVLLKPVSSQFYVSFRHLVFWRLADVGLGMGVTIFAVWKLGVPLQLSYLTQFALVFASSLVIVYSFWVGMMTMSFWAVKVDNLAHLFESFFETARFPVTVYRGVLRLLLTYIFPIAFITSFPAQAAFGKLNWTQAAIAVLLAALFLTMSRYLWKLALRSYTSASS